MIWFWPAHVGSTLLRALAGDALLSLFALFLPCSISLAFVATCVFLCALSMSHYTFRGHIRNFYLSFVFLLIYLLKGCITQLAPFGCSLAPCQQLWLTWRIVFCALSPLGIALTLSLGNGLQITWSCPIFTPKGYSQTWDTNFLADILYSFLPGLFSLAILCLPTGEWEISLCSSALSFLLCNCQEMVMVGLLSICEDIYFIKDFILSCSAFHLTYWNASHLFVRTLLSPHLEHIKTRVVYSFTTCGHF